MEFTLTINKEQAVIIQNALEEYFRLRLGQTMDIADDLAFLNYDYDKHDSKEFDQRIARRNDIRSALDEAMKIAFPFPSVCKSKDCDNAIDIWHVIRQQLYISDGGDMNNCLDVRSDPIFQVGDYSLPTMKVYEEST